MRIWLGMGRALLLVGLIAGLAITLPDTTEATSLNEVKQLRASNPSNSAFFGTSVALSGATAVVGAERGGLAETYLAGAAYVFQRDQGGTGNWGEVTKLLSSDIGELEAFGDSVAISGDLILVGSPFDDPAGVQSGAVYVFQRDQGGTNNWGEVKKLVASDAQSGDLFGISVAISGNTAVVGADREDTGGDSAGTAYVFQRDQGGTDNWGEVTKLLASDAETDDRFGRSVAVSADFIIVGAYFEDAGGTDAGAAYVFQRDQGGADNWGEVKKLAASDIEADDRFGFAVAISSETAVVGARLEDASGSDAGAAYLYQRGQGGADNWGEVKKLTASDAEASDRFGQSVAVNGDSTIIGAPFEAAGVGGAGANYVFQRNQGGADGWGEVTKLTASSSARNDNLGVSVAVSGGYAIAGAHARLGGGLNVGAAYIFDLTLSKPTATQTPTITPTPTITSTLTATRSPTVTPTATPTLPPPVGGVALDSDLRALPLETAGPGNSTWGIGVAIIAAVSLIAAGGAWYVRRRSLS